ncbi:MAG: HAMP domain-containing histidine kinase [Elusimicrobia bacterium]|nr:HAMP domain-containing histidine kinase [Elusimicrobiota bacterium]
MSAFRLTTAVRAVNLLLVIIWLQAFKSSGLMVQPGPAQLLLAGLICASAATAYWLVSLARGWRAAFLAADVAAVALACAFIQPSAADLHFGFLVPLTLAVMTLPARLAAGVCAAAVAAVILLLRAAGRPWLDPLLLVRLSAIAAAPAVAAVMSVHLLGRRVRLLRSTIALIRQQQIAEYITVILFQLREYLTSLTSVTEHLALSAPDGGTRDMAEKMRRIVAEANSKISRTVEAVQTTTRRTLPPPAGFDLAELADQALDAVSIMHPRPLLRARLVCAERISIEGNRNLYFGVLTSVLENAFEAFLDSKPGDLTVTVRPGEPCAEVLVEDDAGGISPDRLSRIFQPFYTTKTDAGGIGLGLSMSRSMLEHVGGSLEISSRGARTAVSLRIPLKPTLPRIRTEQSTWAGRRAAPGGAS